MPNASNADSPITLLGIGRSGTTLLEGAFRAHPNVQSIGESADIIFSTANGAQHSGIPSRNKFSSAAEYTGFVVRQLLVAIEPSPKERWFHKPAGVPKLIPWARLPGEKSAGGFPLEWYWQVLESAFPNGKYLACLRNPWDVVLSWERFRGWEQKHLWRDVLITYRIVSYRFEKFSKVFIFDDFISHPKETLELVFNSVDLPMLDSALNVFNAPRSMGGNEIKTSHSDNWETCQAPPLSEEEADCITKVWKLAGKTFESPKRFQSLFKF